MLVSFASIRFTELREESARIQFVLIPCVTTKLSLSRFFVLLCFGFNLIKRRDLCEWWFLDNDLLLNLDFRLNLTSF